MIFRRPKITTSPDTTRDELMAQNIKLVETLQRMMNTVNYLKPVEEAARHFIEVASTLGANGKALFTITNDDDGGLRDAAVNSVINIATALNGVEPPMHVFQTDRSIH